MAEQNKNRDQEMADQVDDQENENIEEDGTSEMEKVIAERDDYLDQLQRSRAEFINFRKRTEQERQRLGELFTANTLSQFLPVLDDFQRAVNAVPEADKESGWVTGITMIEKKFEGILERAGVTAIDALGQPFDPAVHEAVATEPGTSGQIVVEVYQKGYKLGDTLLRAAMVKTGDIAPGTEQEETKFEA
ncbi:MAG TPA: nucleotide exchange factor GrpE [Thermomicrobiales bacterium]|nr:nucleotide exchange factor GrpE [Thermomicrobiales bacterium]